MFQLVSIIHLLPIECYRVCLSGQKGFDVNACIEHVMTSRMYWVILGGLPLQGKNGWTKPSYMLKKTMKLYMFND